MEVRLPGESGDPTCVDPVNMASVRHDGDFDTKTIADVLFIAQYLVELRDDYFELATPGPRGIWDQQETEERS